MDKGYACYCGLYCGNCPMKLKVNPAAKVLYDEIRNAGFDRVVLTFPGGDSFWNILEMTAVKMVCTSCREGSGDPECAVRICAKEKGVEMCALCTEHPCEHIGKLYATGHPTLEKDNILLRDKGWEEWGKVQDERCNAAKR